MDRDDVVQAWWSLDVCQDDAWDDEGDYVFDAFAEFFDSEAGGAALAAARGLQDAEVVRQALLADRMLRWHRADPDLHGEEDIQEALGQLRSMTWDQVEDLVRRADAAVQAAANRFAVACEAAEVLRAQGVF